MSCSSLHRHGLVCVWGIAAAGLIPSIDTRAAVVTMKNGMQLQGRVDKIASLNENPLNPFHKAGDVVIRPIVIIDDELRFTFVANSQVASYAESPPVAQERIKIQQRVATSGRRIGSVGPIIRITPFDDWGRRIFSMQGGPEGRIDVIQAITEITPTCTVVEGHLGKNSYVWNMRLATSSIPRETLSNILHRQIDPKNADDRLRIVRLYIQSERYQDALVELEGAIEQFPDLGHLADQASKLRQLLAQHLIREIELRRDAGQHRRVSALLSSFPDKGVAGETLLKVRDMLGEYEKRKQQYDRVLELLAGHIAQIKEEGTRAKLGPIHEEIKNELNLHTLNRMADYLRLADDAASSAEQKAALAVSGWLLGSGAATENLAVAMSLVEVRDLTRQYLRAGLKPERDEILEKIKRLEGGSPSYLAKLVLNMTPPLETQPAEEGIPGLFELTVPGIEEQAEFSYYVQLPPEYDAHRRYPCVVTLNGTGSTELQQIDWWAGVYSEAVLMRLGQASRRGYVVIAPKWQKPFQRKYQYTAREHAAALFTLRDACRRFSIDTDRVFLSGHSIGGDAAWDIGLAHPDLWAGVIGIVANADKYVNRYSENARSLPLYFVGGELDGGWLNDNGMDFDRYLTRAGYDCTVVQYRGRGHEHFQDEIQRIFDWMELSSHRRDFFPRELEVVSMRPWDSFFWWLELDDIPDRSLVLPAEWPQSGARVITTKASILENNTITVSAKSGRAVVWLSPEMLSFDRRINVTVNGRNIKDEITPSPEVLLEDVRTRGDRQHPFWAKVQWQGRVR